MVGRMRPSPGPGSQHKQNIGQRRDQIGDQAFPVPPEPVTLAQRVAGSMKLPRLQRDSRCPPRPLLNRGAKPAREILTCCNGAAMPNLHRNEFLLQSQFVDPPAVFIIFREAGRFKNSVGVGLSQSLQRQPRKPGPDTIGRNEPAQQLPRRHVFKLELRELVAINTVGNFAKRSGQRKHRNLHHFVPLRVVIDPAQCVRIHQVFGIVRENHVETHPVLLFVDQHALVDPVKAIRF